MPERSSSISLSELLSSQSASTSYLLLFADISEYKIVFLIFFAPFVSFPFFSIIECRLRFFFGSCSSVSEYSSSATITASTTYFFLLALPLLKRWRKLRANVPDGDHFLSTIVPFQSILLWVKLFDCSLPALLPKDCLQLGSL